MTSRRHLGFVAAGATLMASTPLSLIFEKWTWLIDAIIAVVVIAGAAALTRMLRARPLIQLGGMLLGLLLALTWMFPGGKALVGLIPTPATFVHFGQLLGQSGTDIRDHGVPVQDLDGLLFLCVLGIGLVAIITDLLTVTLRRPALAGLPMLAIYSVPVAVFPGSISITPFVIGACGFMWLLVSDSVDRVRRFGRRFTGEGRDVDAWEPSPLASAGRRLAIVGVVAAILVPLFLPTISGGFFNNGLGNGEGDGPGGPRGTVDLFANLAGKLNQTEIQELLRVTTTDANPYYLRFGVADELTESGFKTHNPTGPAIGTQPLPNPLDRGPQFGVDRKQFHAKVEVTKNFDMPMLPIYAEPILTSKVDGSWAYDSNMEIIFSTRSRSASRTYEFDYVRTSYTSTALRQAPELAADNAIRVQYAHAPLVPEVRQQVNLLIKDGMTQYEKVRAIYDFFSAKNHFRYDTKTLEGTSGSKIVDFLKNRVGFCEQYAAAMAWMVRSAGIPARVAFGFTRGSGFTTGSTFSLTNRNLHAWTEVYFEGFGWVPFDATPAQLVAGSVTPEWAPDPNNPTPAPNSSASVGPGGDNENPGGPSKNPHDPGENGFGGGSSGSGQAPMWPWYLLAGLVGAALAGISPALRRGMLRRRRSAAVDDVSDTTEPLLTSDGTPAGAGVEIVVGGDDIATENYRRRAHAAWDELLDTLVDYRVMVDWAETPRALAARLIAEQGFGAATADGVRLLAWAEERARYARTPLAPTGLAPSLTAVRRSLTEGATRGTRLRATLAPPSVVGRWRAGLVDGVTGTIGRAVRVQDWLVRRLSPRRLMRS